MAQAGKFRERVTFQRLVDSDGEADAYGNTFEAWGGDVRRYADIIERPGKERVEGGALADVGTATVRVRADTVTQAIDNSWRIWMRGQYWDIEGAIQVDRKGAVLEFAAQKGTAA
jgi:head-tail adaptor